MAATYQTLLSAIRRQFLEPAGSCEHNGAHAAAVLRALADLGPTDTAPVSEDFRLAAQGASLEAVAAELRQYAECMTLWGRPAVQTNVVPGPTTASIYASLLALIYNPNLCDWEGSRGFAAAEYAMVRLAADLVGYHPMKADGVFTFGGTGAMLYAVRIGLEKALPGSFREGLRQPATVLASRHSHHCVSSVTGWLGLGIHEWSAVATNSDGSIDIGALESEAREALAAGERIGAIVATMGSTDAFAIDDLRAIHAMRDRLEREFNLRYSPHIHADASIGWAWSAFADYDFDGNPLGFCDGTLQALATATERMHWLSLADSIALDFHKTGYAPYASSLVLFRDGDDFDLIRRRWDETPYLSRAGNRCPGAFTLETSRSAAGPLAALASLRALGKDGLRTLVGHAVDMSRRLRDIIGERREMLVLNGENVGPVTLFRVYPSDVDARKMFDWEMNDACRQPQVISHNEYNEQILRRLVVVSATRGEGLHLSMTGRCRSSKFGAPIAALKSYVLSPFTEEADMAAVVRDVLIAQRSVDVSSTV